MIDERATGVWNRAIVAGVKPSQFLISHLIEGIAVMIIQFVELSVYVLFFLFPSLTWKATVLSLFILFEMGVAGVVFGIFVSVISDDIAASMHINQSFMKIGFFTCGLLQKL